jgi:hypothetical protein
LKLLIGGPAQLYAVLFGVVSLLLQVFVPFPRYVPFLKALTAALFAYVGTVFVVKVPWTQVLYRTLIPEATWNVHYVVAIVAVFGTTRPLAGPFAFYLFAAGIIGTGLLADRPWATPGAGARLLRHHCDRNTARSRAEFHTGGSDQGLVWSAVINGVIAVPVVGRFVVTGPLRLLGCDGGDGSGSDRDDRNLGQLKSHALLVSTGTGEILQAVRLTSVCPPAAARRRPRWRLYRPTSVYQWFSFPEATGLRVRPSLHGYSLCTKNHRTRVPRLPR